MMLRSIFLSLVAVFAALPIFAQCSLPSRVLHYTETTGYDHNTRSVSLSMFQTMGLEAGFTVTSDNDGSMFDSLDSLQQFAVIVFSNTSGANGLDSLQRANMEAYMNAGGSFVGIHAAGDTYRHSTANGNSTGAWDWYAETLTGASVRQGPSHTHWSHIDTMNKAGTVHPVTDSLPDPWIKQEEYYYWENGYLDSTFSQVLAVDQTGNDSYDAPRMMAQIKELPSGGRSFYTGLGHAPVNYTSDTLFYQLIKDAVLWASEPNQSSAVAYSLQVVNPQCTNNGFLQVIPADTSSSYTYSWSTGSSSPAIAGLGQGLYTVTISDSSGCTVSDSVFLTSISGPVLQISISDSISCFGASDGKLSASFSGGTPPYQFAWANGDTGLTRANLPSGTYIALVTDSLGCTVLDSIFLPEPPALTAIVTVADSISCFGGSDGAVTIVATGGAGSYAYFWPNGDTTATRSFLPSGSYFGTATDENGCTASDTGLLTDPDSVEVIFAVISPVLCVGSSSGSVQAGGVGGAAPYSYFWANGDTNSTRSALPSGSYTVTITDQNGCAVTDSISLVDPTALIAGGIISDSVSCFNGSDGSLTGQGSGGAVPYTYTWGNGDTVQTRTGLSAGSYFLTVTDANGCTESTTLTLPEPSAVIASGQVSDSISCAGGSDGSLLVTGTGGTGMYQYFWANGDTAAIRVGVPAGTYFVTVTDQNDCSAGTSISITDPQALSILLSETQAVSCFGGSDGEITISGQGGTGAYQVAWANGDTGFVRSNLPPGTYFATLTDENGCSASDSLALQAGSAVIPQLFVLQEVTCKEDNDASIQANATGGVGPYSYQWENGDTTSIRTGLGGGIYTVTITDAAGCFSVDSVLVTSPDALVPVVLIQGEISCAGEQDGLLEATAAGGELPYSYLWNNGSTNSLLSNVGPGTFTVTVTDQRGCTKTESATVSAPDSLTAVLVAAPDSSCLPTGTGSIEVTPSGGTGMVTISLFDPSGTPIGSDSTATVIFSSLSEGWYSIMMEDANMCLAEDSVEVGDACLQGNSIGTLTDLEEFIVFRKENGEISVSARLRKVQKVKISVISLHGQILSERELHGKEVEETFSSATFAEGIYYLRIETKEGSASRRLIVR